MMITIQGTAAPKCLRRENKGGGGWWLPRRTGAINVSVIASGRDGSEEPCVNKPTEPQGSVCNPPFPLVPATQSAPRDVTH